MTSRLGHYRIKCVDDFKNAEDGSVNLESYARGFRDDLRIQDLQSELQALIQGGLRPESMEEMSRLSRKLHHEIERAAFPGRYVRFGVNIFGSARLQKGDAEFQEVVEISERIISKYRADINTGGGPGVMEAANLGLVRGAKLREASSLPNGVRNYGLTIKLPFEEFPNEHLNVHVSHSNFGSRLSDFADRGHAAVSWTGGAGTDLENAFIYQLRQVRHLEPEFPIIFRRSSWEAIQKAKLDTMYHDRLARGQKPLISPEDLNLVQLVERPEDVMEIISRRYEQWERDVWNKLDATSQEAILQD